MWISLTLGQAPIQLFALLVPIKDLVLLSTLDLAEAGRIWLGALVTVLSTGFIDRIHSAGHVMFKLPWPLYLM